MNVHSFTSLQPLNLAPGQSANAGVRSSQSVEALPFPPPLPNLVLQQTAVQPLRVTLPDNMVPVIILNVEQFQALLRGQSWVLADDVYVGQTLNRKRHGTGTCIYTTRDRYDGEWKDNMREGHGMMVLSNGESYIGEWKENKMHGRGSFSRWNGDCLEADWVDGQPTNPVIYHYANNDIYQGDWANFPHGRGVYHFAPGGPYRRFEGVWNAGNKHGIGHLYLANGQKIDEIWDHGKLI